MSYTNKKYILLGFMFALVFQGWSQAGKVIIQSDATGTGSLIVGPQSSTLSVEVNRYIHSTNWHIISSGVTGQQLGTFATSNALKQHLTIQDYDLAPYEEASDSWSPYTEASNSVLMGVGRGYSMRKAAVGAVKFSGTINSGTINVPITKSNYGWNAVGNPFTSAIRAKGTDGFLLQNIAALDDSYAGIYVWDQSFSGGDYRVITAAGYEFDPPGGESKILQNNLAVGQGFIIRAKAGGTVTFDSLMQVHSIAAETPFKSAEISWPAIRLSVSAGNDKNNTDIAFNQNMTLGLDPSYDVGKFKGNPKFALYTKLVDDNGVDFAFQSLPIIDLDKYRIPIGLDFTIGGFVTFTSAYINLPANAKIIIEDTKTNTFTRLDGVNEKYVTFIKQNAFGYGRFYLHTSDAQITDVPELKEADFMVFAAFRKIQIHGETDGNTMLNVYSVDGKIWYQDKALNQNYNTIDASGFVAGVYILHIKKSGNTTTHKLVLSGR